MRASAMPVIFRHSRRVSSSAWWTVTYSRSGWIPIHSELVTHSHANSIAPCLK